MSEQLMIYLWSISDGLNNILAGCGSLLIVVPILFNGLIKGIYDEVKPDELWESIKRPIIIGITLLMMTNIMPSKQDLALIFLYPKIKQGIETTLVSPIAKKMLDIVNLYLDKQIKDLK